MGHIKSVILQLFLIRLHSKTMDPIDRFKENQSGMILDQEQHLQWHPKDAYQNLGKWINWDEAVGYVKLMNQYYPGGFGDWRLPTREEALSLFDDDFTLKDAEGQEVHINKLFVPKCSYYIWTGEDEEDQAFCVNLRNGEVERLPKITKENHSARLVRIFE